jgi:hypothetical protein
LCEELSDRHLVLKLLHGLNKKYDHMKALIKRTKPLPSFHAVYSDFEQHATSTASSAPPPSYVPTGGPLVPLPLLLTPAKARAKGRGRARVVVVVQDPTTPPLAFAPVEGVAF